MPTAHMPTAPARPPPPNFIIAAMPPSACFLGGWCHLQSEPYLHMSFFMKKAHQRPGAMPVC
jgi:hypothetical protein